MELLLLTIDPKQHRRFTHITLTQEKTVRQIHMKRSRWMDGKKAWIYGFSSIHPSVQLEAAGILADPGLLKPINYDIRHTLKGLPHIIFHMSSTNDFKDLTPDQIREIFPETKLTIKDKIPLNQLIFLTCLQINKAILNIKYSSDEVVEIVHALICQIPEEEHDEQFLEDLKNAYYIQTVDVRPVFCTTPASLEYCARKKIPAFVREKRPDYRKLYTAAINVLNRRNMLTKKQAKQLIISTFPEDR